MSQFGLLGNYDAGNFSAGSMGGLSGGGGSSGGKGGIGGGLPWMQIAQFALQEKNREAADRWRLAQGINEAMNDSAWLMSHFPNFWGSNYVNPNAGAVDASLGQQTAAFQSAIKPIQEEQSEQRSLDAKMALEKWKYQQKSEDKKSREDKYNW